jgi:hypothetical protein
MQRRLPHLKTSRVVEAALWALPIAGLEILGRRSPSDAIDAIGVAVVTLLGILAWTRFHVRRRLREAPAMRRLRAWIASWKPTAGLDFRQEPALEFRAPAPFVVLLGAPLGLVLVLWLSREVWPSAARDALRSVSGFAALVFVTGLWSSLAAGTIAFFLLPLFYLKAELLNSRRPRYRRLRLEFWTGTAYLLALVACALCFPPAWGLALLAFSLCAFCCVSLFPGCRMLRITWKYVQRPSDLAWFRWSGWIVGSGCGLTAVCLCLVLLSRGDRFEGGGSEATNLTAFLGLSFLWASVGGCSYTFLREAFDVFVNGMRDPARPMPTCVFVEGVSDRAERRGLGAVLSHAGFRARWAPNARRTCDVPVVVAATASPAGPFAPSVWPRSVTIDELGGKELHRVLRRRGDILCRRELMGRLRSIFKQASGRVYQHGEGFWIAPHLWFITHLSRDTDEEDCWFIGPSYHKTISRAARSHMHQVLAALDIDLIFLEDGVGFRRFKRVLSLIFEYYDMFGGRRLDDERPFSGIPETRVVIHDHELEKQFDSAKYPEPDYEELGRARILHVFRDRGGDDEAHDPMGSSLRIPTRLPRLMPV